MMVNLLTMKHRLAGVKCLPIINSASISIRKQIVDREPLFK